MGLELIYHESNCVIKLCHERGKNHLSLSTSLCRLDASLACSVSMVAGITEYRLMLISFLLSSLYFT